MTAHTTLRRGRRIAAATAAASVAALALSSCSLPFFGGGSTPVKAESGAVDFDGVQSATLQIEARGTFVSPEEGGYEAAGRGSGFIISKDGIAVTNNHVVVGAGTLDIWIGGDQSKTYNAKVLGSSECLDLAVIQLQTGEYPFFDWRDDEIAVADDVYAAGFPLGDPTFTMTRGIVSKASTPVSTPWASLDSVIEHDARIRGGNSGGPLIDPEGRVLGVNYAGSDLTDQNLAIHRDEATAVIEQLSAGENVLSLGINGEGLMSSDGTGLGVWVASVAAGSVADKAGVEPGDLITRMQGVSVGTDGTMAEYCDVLRTQGQEATMDVELYRPSDEIYYRGQFSGDPLEPVQVISGATASGEFEYVTDDQNIIEVEVPAEWTDFDGSGYSDEYGTWARVSASPDLDAFNSTWTTPGVFIAASQDAVGVATPEALLAPVMESLPSQGCRTNGVQSYDDGYHVGQYAIFDDCGGVGAQYVVVVANSTTSDYVVQVGVQANSDEDLAAIDRVLGSFYASF